MIWLYLCDSQLEIADLSPSRVLAEGSHIEFYFMMTVFGCIGSAVFLV
jgi:hypothetical protein